MLKDSSRFVHLLILNKLILMIDTWSDKITELFTRKQKIAKKKEKSLLLKVRAQTNLWFPPS